MKKAFLNLLFRTGSFAPFHAFNENKVLILTYHRFSETETPFTVSSSQLTAHLTYLTKHRKILSLTEISKRLRAGDEIPKNTAVITIDDGYRDAYEIAFPIFKKFAVPATLFVVTDFLDGKIWVWTDKMRFIASQMKTEKAAIEIAKQPVELENGTPAKIFQSGSKANSILKKLPNAEKDRLIEQIAEDLKVKLPDLPPAINSPILWEQAREMDAGSISIESHTVTHPILPNVSDTQLNFELQKSKKRLEEKLQKEIRSFCYPAGATNEKVWRAVKQNDYECAVTNRYGFNVKTANRFLLNRIDAQPEAAYFAQSTSGFEGFRRKFKMVAKFER